jgi:hypothetical protein
VTRLTEGLCGEALSKRFRCGAAQSLFLWHWGVADVLEVVNRRSWQGKSFPEGSLKNCVNFRARSFKGLRDCAGTSVPSLVP